MNMHYSALTPSQKCAQLCTTLRFSGKLHEALAAGMEAIKLEPDNAAYFVDLSMVLIDLRMHDHASSLLLNALARDPNSTNAHLALAHNLLIQGEFAAGWKEYEWRKHVAGEKQNFPDELGVEWNGMRMPNLNLLVFCDQGFGDQIQFARYLPMVARHVGSVVVACSRDIAPIMRQIPGVATVCTSWDELPPCGAFIRLCSLPGICGTDLASIPGETYIQPPPVKAALAQKGPHVGVCWQGSVLHNNNRLRSIPIETMAPILEVKDVDVIPLQKSPYLKDYGDTAALIDALDLVITVDTSVAHLAGAMGKPVWIMLPSSPDWRWMHDTTTSPWYPTARLFRQETPGDWDSVVSNVVASLKEGR